MYIRNIFYARTSPVMHAVFMLNVIVCNKRKKRASHLFLCRSKINLNCRKTGSLVFQIWASDWTDVQKYNDDKMTLTRILFSNSIQIRFSVELKLLKYFKKCFESNKHDRDFDENI